MNTRTPGTRSLLSSSHTKLCTGRRDTSGASDDLEEKTSSNFTPPPYHIFLLALAPACCQQGCMPTWTEKQKIQSFKGSREGLGGVGRVRGFWALLPCMFLPRVRVGATD